MCFVTYLPQQEGFVLTSNRDEHAGRPKALPPKKYTIGCQSVFYPKDGLAGGTWIAASARFTLCLLNGAFVNHVPQPPYRRSRGLVLLDFFEINDVIRFVSAYNFAGIEPFTLVIVAQEAKIELHQLRWDTHQLHHHVLEAQAAFAWSSATLYDANTVQERATWFAKWHQTPGQRSAGEVIDFHLSGGKGDKRNDLVMNRNNELMTVSVMQVQQVAGHFLLQYQDRLNAQNYRYRIL